MQGTKINGYTLQHLLGTGGMAEVWYAENKIGKKAAVKFLLPKFCADDSIVARFENEAKVMVELEHPNIRQVYDYDNIDGRPCIIMEYLEGDDLKAMMKKGQIFKDEDLMRWWNQMVSALNYTHALGIVHRDIKPSNIFIDKHGNVRLLDFGIAKNNDGGSGTMTGSTLGTRIYMSPEQVKDPKRVDYHTDLYSLAVTFVHLLTGKAPYDSTTSSDFEIQLSIVSKPLDLSKLPESWRNFIEPYLDKEPNKRPELRDFEIQKKERSNTIVEVPLKDDETIVETNPDQETILSTRNLEDLELKVNGVSFVMKYIEGGGYNMGADNKVFNKKNPNYDYQADDDESPVHEVEINSFYLGETVVTKQLYCAIMDCDINANHNIPITNISWNDCHEIINKLNKLTGRHFRLPTEAEWEYAARGGTKARGCIFAGSNNINETAWYSGNSDYTPHPVAKKQPNELGLYDMSGNVVEWCEDLYGQYNDSKQINPKGSANGNYRVMRGGCWGYEASRCRITNREIGYANATSGCYGFRLALSE